MVYNKNGTQAMQNHLGPNQFLISVPNYWLIYPMILKKRQMLRFLQILRGFYKHAQG